MTGTSVMKGLKVVLINLVAIFMVSANLATLGFLKIKIYRNKKFDVIISLHDVTNKILSSNSVYIVQVW